MTLDKVGVFQDGDGDKFADVGELISYSFLVKNIGNVTLSNISVTDPNVSSISCPVVGNPIPTLAVGASQTCTGSYAITQADIDAGQKLNTAIASGKGPQGQPASDTGTATVTIPQNPALSVEKSANAEQVTAAGQVVQYSYVVKNVGNVTLTGVTLSDDNIDRTPHRSASKLALLISAMTLALGTGHTELHLLPAITTGATGL